MKLYKITYKANGELKETTCTSCSVDQFSRVLDIVEISEIEKPKKEIDKAKEEKRAQYKRKYESLYKKYKRGSISKNEFDEAIRELKRE